MDRSHTTPIYFVSANQLDRQPDIDEAACVFDKPHGMTVWVADGEGFHIYNAWEARIRAVLCSPLQRLDPPPTDPLACLLILHAAVRPGGLCAKIGVVSGTRADCASLAAEISTALAARHIGREPEMV